jgi:ABC-2 type transport system permease protein
MIDGMLRAFAFVRKEIIDVGRQPLLVLALIVGPFVILFAFGAGLRDTDPQLRTVLIVPEDSVVAEQVEEFAAAERERERLEIDEVSSDESEARTRLASRELDLVIVFPDDVGERVEQGERAVIRIFHNQIDPVEGQAITLFARTAVSEINDRLLEDVVTEIQEAVEERNAEDQVPYADLEPEVLVSPFRGETELLGGRPLERADFYAPAVLVVLLQHLAVTLLGLSVVRERNLGADDLFRVSPLRTAEYVLGKLLAYLVIGGIVGAALIALLVYGLDTPMQGGWWSLAGALGALLFTSIALGLVVALLANTDSQAVQYAMLVLIATIFLSGFLLSLERFVPAVRTAAWVLPASSGIEMVRDVMLRGVSPDLSMLFGLVAYGLVFIVLAAVLAQRRLIRPGID